MVTVCVLTNLRQTVQLHGALHSHVSAQVGELHLNELARVQRSMPVPAQKMKFHSKKLIIGTDLHREKKGKCV